MAQAAAVRVRPQAPSNLKSSKTGKPGTRQKLQSIQRTTKTRNKNRRPSLAGRLSLLFVATVLISQVVLFTYAQNARLIHEVFKFPCRIISSVVSGAVGGVNGGFEGIINAERSVTEQTFAQAESNPLMIPAGIVGIAVAIPVGFVSGAPNAMMQSGSQGYLWWDTMGQG